MAKSVFSMLPTAAMPAAFTSPSSRPCFALDLGGDALPVGLRGHVERRIDAFAAGQIGGDRRAAGALDRGHHGGADGARGAR